MIMGLLLSVNSDAKAYNAILVVVDYFTKIAKYFPVQKTLDIVELTNYFYKRIVYLFRTL